jgi:hypothetical protein
METTLLSLSMYQYLPPLLPFEVDNQIYCLKFYLQVPFKEDIFSSMSPEAAAEHSCNVTAGYSGCCQNIMRKKPTETTVR